ncbi:beta strand repeat-containing protein [Nocardioides ultimimeridianus]
MRGMLRSALATAVAGAAVPLVLALPARAGTVTLTVTSTADSADTHPGDGTCASSSGCTLRAAIQEANALYADDDSTVVDVDFAIPGGGPHVIRPVAHLPAVDARVDLLATTQPGYSAGHPQVVLDGITCGCTGLVLLPHGSVVSGFDVQRFYTGIELAPTKDVFAPDSITASFIGTDATGAASAGNVIGVDDFQQSGAIIGGTTAAERNVISGNTTDVYVEGRSNIAWIEGNYIGTNAAGTAALPIRAPGALIPGECSGVFVDGATNIHVGASGGGGNVISLGTTKPTGGCKATYNNGAVGDIGIDGVRVALDHNLPSAFVAIQGDRIGTTADGTAAIGNDVGIDLGTAYQTSIGGPLASSRNVISGNTDAGVASFTGAVQTFALLNYIGTDATGSTAVPNGTGLRLAGPSDISAGNVISGNTHDGLVLTGDGTSASDRVGLDASGNALGNGGVGVHVGAGAKGAVYGSTVADNGGAGVATDTGGRVDVSAATTLHDNGGLGIDLGDDGVTANAAGSATNAPVITGRITNDVNGHDEVDGTLDAKPSSAYVVNLYDDPVCDPSGNGEATNRIGFTTVHTDAAGHASFGILDAAVEAGHGVSATATGPAGTSELSACFQPVVLMDQSITGGSGVSGTPTTVGGTGTTYRWIGGSLSSNGDNHSWGDSRNWLPHGVPGDGDSAYISQPGGGYCSAYVDGVPTVSLVDFSLAGTANTCGSSVTGGAITVTGQMAWNGGRIATPITVAAGAHATVTGGGQNELDADLDIKGDLTLSGVIGASGRLAFSVYQAQAATVHVEQGATLYAEGDNDLTGNTGTLVNDGTVSVSGGTLGLRNGAKLVQDASVVTSGHGALVDEGAATLGAGATYAGDGKVELVDGPTSLQGDQSVGEGMTLQLAALDADLGDTVSGTGTFTGAGRLAWDGGTIEANLTIGPGFHLDVLGDHIPNGDRVLAGKDQSNGAVTATLVNHGTITVGDGANIHASVYDAPHLTNASDGTIALAPGSTIGGGNVTTLVDTGHVAVPAGSRAGAVLDRVALADTGGTIAIAPAQRLELGSGASSTLAGTTISGGGTFADDQSTTITGSPTVAATTTFELDGGGVDGATTLGGAGRFAWLGGTLSGASLRLATTGGISVSGATTKHLGRTTGNAPSTVVLAGPTTIGSGVVDDLYGPDTLRLAAATTASGPATLAVGSLVNAGALTVRSGTLTVPGLSQATGSTDVVAGARLAGSSPAAALTFAGGLLEGSGTVSGAVTTGRATVAPGAAAYGRLTVSGSLTGTSSTVLSVGMSATAKDRLAVSGTVVLGHRVAARNVGYVPRFGAGVPVASGSSLTGGACVVTSGAGSSTGHWRIARTARVLTLVWAKGHRSGCV